MNPRLHRLPAEDPARQEEAERYVRTAKGLLSGSTCHLTHYKVERARFFLTKALVLDPCTPDGEVLLAAAIALRTTTSGNLMLCLPSGSPDPYLVFGLDAAVPTARDPAVIELYYRQAFDLLSRANHFHPCYPAISKAIGLIADAWAILSDSRLKESLDARFNGLDNNHSAAPSVTSPPPPAAMTTPPTGDVVHGRLSGLPVRRRSARLAAIPRRPSGLPVHRRSARLAAIHARG